MARAMAHLKYIQHRPGEDRGPEGREFFDDIDDNLDVKALRKDIRELGNSKVVIHKVTLAPEINPAYMRQFTREVMHQLGRDKGLDLKWMAVEHSNTEHDHVHVVIAGKDKNGKDVRIDKKDYNKIKESGDRHLERWHPLEFARARSERELKEKERKGQRKRELEAQRQERIREGLELPWMHKKIVREQLEPYDKWRKQQLKIERAKSAAMKKERVSAAVIEQPQREEMIKAAGKEWSKQNTLSELRELNTYLWDNYDQRIDKAEYKKLVTWLKEKERLGEPQLAGKDEPPKMGTGEREPGAKGKKQKAKEQEKQLDPPKDYFEYKGQKYGKDSPYEKLSGLVERLRDKKADRLPIENYQQLRSWTENADRARWAGVVEKQLELAKTRYGVEGAQKHMPNAFRSVSPLQAEMMRNPVVGIFMAGASVANELVRWIPLTDQRDRLKESLDELEAAKLDKHQDYLKADKPEEREQDQEVIDKIDRAIDENIEIRKKDRSDKKGQKEGRKDRTDDINRPPSY